MRMNRQRRWRNRLARARRVGVPVEGSAGTAVAQPWAAGLRWWSRIVRETIRRVHLIFVLVVGVGCAATPFAATAGQPEGQPPMPPRDATALHAPDRLLVKLKPEAAEAVKQARLQGQAALTGLASLDAVLASVRAESIEPIFPSERDIEAIKKKFPQRTKRAPPRAPGIAEPALSNYYKVMLKPGADVQRAVAALAADPNVESAQLDYLATIQSTTEPMP